MAKPSPYQITAFTETARERSFSKAAAVLNVTQSSVTQHVSNLEKTIGAQLFIRRREGLEVTQAGRELYEITDRLRTLQQLIEEKIEDYGTMNSGKLNIVANAPRPALPIIERYLTQYPGVQIDFALVSWDLAMTRLKDRDVDVAFVVEPEAHDGLSIFEINKTRYRAFVHGQHRLAKRARISLKDLETETVILPEDGSLTQRVVLETANKKAVGFSSILKTTTFPMVKEAVLHGVGVGFMLQDGQFASSQIVALEVAELQQSYRNCLVTSSEKRELRLVNSFCEVAQDMIL